MSAPPTNPNKPDGLLPPALRHRNFILFFSGQGISLIGTWMQTTALQWLVWRLTEKERYLGWISFASQLPNLLFTPVAGVMADRHSRHRMVILTQTLAMVQAFILAWLTLSGRVSFNQILGLCFALGIINSFDMPIRQSFVVEMVGRDDLPSAIALNSFMFNLARVIGPTIGGYAIKHISEGTIFGINSLSYLVVIFALALIKPIPFEREPARGNIAENITDGVKFVRSHLALRDALLYVGLISFMGLPYQMMMPAFAGKVFGRESQGFATMVTAIGLGALLGGIILVRFPSSYRIERLIPLAGMAFGLGLIALSVTPLIFPSMDRNFWLAVAVLVPTGGAIMTQTVCTNTFLQKLVPDRMRGRVLSFYTLMLLGLVPIGSLIAGYLAETIGLLNAARLGGAACVAGGFVVLTRMPLIRASAAKLLEEQHRDSAEFTAQTEI